MNIVRTAPSPDSSSASASDNELISAVANDRSAKALETLYRRHRPMLRSVIARVLNTDSDADDVLQKVLIQVWHHAESYSADKGNLLGWLITLARRRSVDHVRKVCAYRTVTERYEKQCEPTKPNFTDTFIVDREVYQNELQQQMTAVMNKLPEAQREAIGLTYYQGLSQREISSRLSVPLGTIKTRIELGMRKLGRTWVSEQAA
jgi:RNA polymerase sigma-70 factor (ECF subfamily)